MSMDLGADGKVVKKIQEKFKTSLPQVSSVIVSLDDEGERWAFVRLRQLPF